MSGDTKVDWHSAARPPAFSREEVIRAIERRGNCRIPQSFEPIPLLFRNEALYEFFLKWPNDIIYLDMRLEPRRFYAVSLEEGIYLHGSGAIRHLVEDWSQMDEACDRLMPPLTQEWVNLVRSEVEKTPGYYHAVVHIALLFEFVYALRGMERFFIDLYDERDKVERVLDRILAYTCEMMKGYGEAGVDCIMIGDDWGSQLSLLINPQIWREVFKPRYKLWVEACHQVGLHVIFHSDGNLDAIFHDLVETGIDIYNPLQPYAMDVDRWLKEYKGKLTFWTGVDVQMVLPFASPQQVRDEIKKSVDKFSDESGGFILGPTNAITAEVPYENLVAVYETLLEYR